MGWEFEPETGYLVLRPDPEPSTAHKVWDFAWSPTTHLFGLNLAEETKKKMDEIAPAVESWASRVGPEVGHAIASGFSETPVQTEAAPVTPEQAEMGRKVTGGLAGAGMGAVEGAVQAAEGFTSPVNLATMGLGARVKGLESAYKAAVGASDMLNAAKLAQQLSRLRTAEVGAGGLMTAGGVQGAVEAPDLPSKLISLAGAAGGLAGMAHGALGGAAARGAGKVLTEYLKEPGGNPLDVSGPVGAGPRLAEVGPQFAGNPAKKAAYLKRIEESGQDIGNTTGMSAKQIRQWGEEHGVDFSDVVVQRLAVEEPGAQASSFVTGAPEAQDPVGGIVKNVANTIWDNLMPRLSQIPALEHLTKRLENKGDLPGIYEGRVVENARIPLGIGAIRLPRWIKPEWEGQLAVNRPARAEGVLYRMGEPLEVPQDPVRLQEAVAAYRESIPSGIAHEILHGVKGAIDTVQGEPIQAGQEMMNAAAQELLTAVDPKTGLSLRQELGKLGLDPPVDPQARLKWEQTWTQDFIDNVNTARLKEKLQNTLGVQETVDELAQASAIVRKGGDISGLPKELAEELETKVAAGFRMQWEGRGDANARVRAFHNQQIQIREKWTRKVQEEGLDPRQAYINAAEELKGLGAGIRVAGAPGFTPEEASALHGKVLGAKLDRPRVIGAADAMEKFIRGTQLQKNELELMRGVFGKKLVGGEPEWMEKFLDALYRSHGTLRSLVTAFDVSAALRQGLIPTIAHPGIAKAAFQTMWKGMWTERGQVLMEKTIFGRPLFELGDAAGLHLSQPGGQFGLARAAMGRGGAEEVYTPSYAEKIPLGVGAGVKISERAYILYLNKIRAELFDKMAYQFMRQGISFEQQPQVYRDLAKGINNLTGRGELELAYISPTSPMGKRMGLKTEVAPLKEQAEMAIPFFNTLFFAPRFMAARLAILRDLPLLYSNYSAPVRNMMLRDVAVTIGTGLSVLSAAAALTGGTLEGDPRSSDFGKLKIGNTRYDIWGGFQPWIRFTAQLVSGQRKSTQTGRMADLTKNRGRRDLFYRFLEQKTSPAVSLASDIVLGKPTGHEPVKFLNDQFPYMGDLNSRLLPFVIQDMQDVWNQGEAEQLALAAPLSALGVGVQSYGGQ